VTGLARFVLLSTSEKADSPRSRTFHETLTEENGKGTANLLNNFCQRALLGPGIAWFTLRNPQASPHSAISTCRRHCQSLLTVSLIAVRVIRCCPTSLISFPLLSRFGIRCAPKQWAGSTQRSRGTSQVLLPRLSSKPSTTTQAIPHPDPWPLHSQTPLLNCDCRREICHRPCASFSCGEKCLRMEQHSPARRRHQSELQQQHLPLRGHEDGVSQHVEDQPWP
jgi:hypothetical protein